MAARIIAGTAPRLVSMRLAASAIELAVASLRNAERTRRLAAHSSMLLANHTVQVTTEAKTRPIITDFTTMSASMNIFHGDRSRGRLSAPTMGVGEAGGERCRRGRAGRRHVIGGSGR